MHEDNFGPRVNFARVTILHGGLFLHDSKKKRIKYILKKTEKTLKDKLIKKLKEKKLLTEGKG